MYPVYYHIFLTLCSKQYFHFPRIIADIKGFYIGAKRRSRGSSSWIWTTNRYKTTASSATEKVSIKASANGRNKTQNKCETQNEIVFHIRLPETINSVSLSSVSRIRQTDVQPVLHLEVSCFGIAHTVNKTSSKH